MRNTETTKSQMGKSATHTQKENKKHSTLRRVWCKIQRPHDMLLKILI